MNLADLTAWVEEERPDLDDQDDWDVEWQEQSEVRYGLDFELERETARWLRGNDAEFRAYREECLDAKGKNGAPKPKKPSSWTRWCNATRRFVDPPEWTPRPVPVGYLAPLEVRSRDGFCDVDGTWCDAGELMQGTPLFGRAKTFYDDTEHDAPVVHFRDLGQDDEGGFLAAGGWHIKHAGTTGQPVGRPARGVRIPERIALRMSRLHLDPDVLEAYTYYAFDFHDPNGKRVKTAQRRYEDILTAKAGEDNVNIDALSRVSGVKKRTVERRRERGVKKLSQKAPKGGEEEMTNEVAVIERYEQMRREGVGYHEPMEMPSVGVLEHVDRRFDRLEQRLDEDLNDVFRAIMAFRETEPEAWKAYIEKRNRQKQA